MTTEEHIKDRIPAIYVAGPMRGLPEFNFPAFFAAADEWRKKGYRVFNPAQKDVDTHGKEMFSQNKTGDERAATTEGFSLRDALTWDTNVICQECVAIYMLKGWEKSAGANAEWALAKALGLEIHYQ
jgi:hypothetical protein